MSRRRVTGHASAISSEAWLATVVLFLGFLITIVSLAPPASASPDGVTWPPPSVDSEAELVSLVEENLSIEDPVLVDQGVSAIQAEQTGMSAFNVTVEYNDGPEQSVSLSTRSPANGSELHRVPLKGLPSMIDLPRALQMYRVQISTSGDLTPSGFDAERYVPENETLSPNEQARAKARAIIEALGLKEYPLDDDETLEGPALRDWNVAPRVTSHPVCASDAEGDWPRCAPTERFRVACRCSVAFDRRPDTDERFRPNRFENQDRVEETSETIHTQSMHWINWVRVFFAWDGNQSQAKLVETGAWVNASQFDLLAEDQARRPILSAMQNEEVSVNESTLDHGTVRVFAASDSAGAETGPVQLVWHWHADVHNDTGEFDAVVRQDAVTGELLEPVRVHPTAIEHPDRDHRGPIERVVPTAGPVVVGALLGGLAAARRRVS